jgi:ureidoglycolate amidohydrolase
VNADDPATCSPHIVDVIDEVCRSYGITAKHMVSRAYHDSLFMSAIAPTAMIFIPCRGGVSHRPDEYSSPEAIARGALILAEALAELAA